jgi:CheY-like chemotaxis protein
MDRATLARAAEPFFTTKPRGQGTGLGLAMARGFAEQSGGALALSSVQGHGTKISVWLPQAQPGTADSEHHDSDEAAAQLPQSAPKVLVVDDDALICETMCETLQIAGYKAFSAPNAMAALPIVKQAGEVDLLLTDFSMPGLNGVGLIREAQRHRPDLPAILMTGYAGDVAGLSNDETANVHFVLLRKPVSSHELFAQLASLLPEKAEPGPTAVHADTTTEAHRS